MSRPKLAQLEQAVVTYMARGYKPGRIAAALGISQSHYTKVRDRILDKLGATNDVQIGMFVERLQLVSADERERIELRRGVVLQ
jgi:DNA-binding NarL/FixJ family response regulator